MKNRVLTIARPCSENWDLMTPSEKGRFCNKCKKEVTDFTKMTTDQVVDCLTQKSGQSICGRLRIDQTERSKSKYHLIVAKLNLNTARFFILLGISAIFSLTGCGSIKEEINELKNACFPPKPQELHREEIMGKMAIVKTKYVPIAKAETDLSKK